MDQFLETFTSQNEGFTIFHPQNIRTHLRCESIRVHEGMIWYDLKIRDGSFLMLIYVVSSNVVHGFWLGFCSGILQWLDSQCHAGDLDGKETLWSGELPNGLLCGLSLSSSQQDGTHVSSSYPERSKSLAVWNPHLCLLDEQKLENISVFDEEDDDIQESKWSMEYRWKSDSRRKWEDIKENLKLYDNLWTCFRKATT